MEMYFEPETYGTYNTKPEMYFEPDTNGTYNTKPEMYFELFYSSLCCVGKENCFEGFEALSKGSFHVKSTKKNRHPSQISPKLGSYIVCTKSSNHNNF